MRGPQYGNWVYVNEKELGRWNFVENDMAPASAACAIVLQWSANAQDGPQAPGRELRGQP